MDRAFRLVDVFGDGDFTGNPLAVVSDAQGLDTETMQGIARWLNLSETTFLLPPDDAGADYRVRIFTLNRELPFAGHPTLGTCHAWLAAGHRPRVPGRIVQQCAVGLVTVRQEADGALAFAAPPLLRSGPLDAGERAEAARFLGIAEQDIVAAQWVDNGPGWLAVMLASAEAVLAVRPARQSAAPVMVGVVGPHPEGSEARFEVRAFLTDQHGAVLEDPVTGSLNAALALWLLESGATGAPYVAAQGAALGRRGRVRIERDDDGTVWVGGQARTMVAGRGHF